MIQIGIDGGGTKTSLNAYRDGKLIASARSGPMNYNFIGINDATCNVLSGISALGIPSEQISAVGIGDPSIDDIVTANEDSSTAKFIKQISDVLHVPVFVRSDAYMTLFALTGGKKEGVMILSGTGAMGIAEDLHGNVYVAGGWGRLFDDDGSGYYIALEAMKAAVRDYDGIAPKTALTEALKSHYHVSDLRQLIPILYDNENRTEIADFSEIAAKCAENGDEVARRILLDAAGYLASFASVLLQRSGAETVGYYGSVISKNEIVLEEFKKILRQKYSSVDILPPPISAEQAAAEYAVYMLEKSTNNIQR